VTAKLLQTGIVATGSVLRVALFCEKTVKGLRFFIHYCKLSFIIYSSGVSTNEVYMEATDFPKF
jgi:hypothetical protein